MKYKKKPIAIEAVQLQDNDASREEVMAFTQGNAQPAPGGGLSIFTLDGVMLAQSGDYVIKGVKGEFYPCKEDIFKESYEGVL